MSGQWSGGKGDRMRKGADQKKYRENWDKIFKKPVKDTKYNDKRY